MKFLARAALFSLICTTIPLSFAYAQDESIFDDDLSVEEMDLTNDDMSNDEKEKKEIPSSCGQTITGTVPDYPDNKFCNIYQRQLAFRNSAKDFRASIEKRRASFAVPRAEALGRYREDMAELYLEETAAYKKEREELEKKAAAGPKKDEAKGDASKDSDEIEIITSLPDDGSTNEEGDTDEKATSKDKETTAANETEDILKEKEYPTEEKEDGSKVKKKVITSSDAPDFDESPF